MFQTLVTDTSGSEYIDCFEREGGLQIEKVPINQWALCKETLCVCLQDAISCAQADGDDKLKPASYMISA